MTWEPRLIGAKVDPSSIHCRLGSSLAKPKVSGVELSFDLVVGYRPRPPGGGPRMVRLLLGLCALVLLYCYHESVASLLLNAPAMPTKHLRSATARQLLLSDHISHRLSLRAGSQRIQEGLLRRSPEGECGRALRGNFVSSTQLSLQQHCLQLW